MKILGVHDGHNASAALLIDGKLEYLIQEERIVAEKNRAGFPYEAIKLILQKSGLKPKDIDWVGLNGNYMPKPTDRQGTLDYYRSLLTHDKAISLSRVKNRLKGVKILAKPYEEINKQSRVRLLTELGFAEKKIQFVNHHLTHAASAYYGKGNFKDEVLVLTNDGAGDRICATVSVVKDGVFNKIAEVHENHSVALVYAAFTYLTGMVPLEHEYKLMGMAPYADKKGCRKVADALWDMFRLTEQGITWEFIAGPSVYASMNLFKEFMFLKRFDHLMGGLQLFTEEFLVKWVQACIQKTGVKKLALAGGTFMNVKANKLIMELPEVEDIYITPSCGDESNPLGIVWHMYQTETGSMPTPVGHAYLGIEWSNSEIEKAFHEFRFKKKVNISLQDNIEEKAAELLAAGHVVARFKGREEFGARSLGNRAILADPANPDVIREINEMIKNRDFWMPFASSYLDTDIDRYVKTYPEKNDPWYMIMTFDTHPLAYTEMAAGIHPYDKTVRPQLVTQEHNQAYWNLIHAFKQRTGRGGLLNTSLNLHGLPLVHSPQDAFHVMNESNLKHLVIGDFLVSVED
jgi:carbamoyltransferase